jgi:hypothetical protein
MDLSRKLVDTYLCDYFINGAAAATTLDLVPQDQRAQFQAYYQNEILQVKANFPPVPSPFKKSTFSRNTGALLPVFYCILRSNEDFRTLHANDDPLQVNLPRLFTLGPMPLLKWEFMTLNT